MARLDLKDAKSDRYSTIAQAPTSASGGGLTVTNRRDYTDIEVYLAPADALALADFIKENVKNPTFKEQLAAVPVGTIFTSPATANRPAIKGVKIADNQLFDYTRKRIHKGGGMADERKLIVEG